MNLVHQLFRCGASGFVFLLLGHAGLAAPRPVDLRCEYLSNPLAIAIVTYAKVRTAPSIC